jgi:acyl-CoA synthetase (AMP-forming)/AMP-acid ligase II
MTRARHLLRDGSFVSVYGSTEAEPIAHVAAGEMTPSDYQEMVTGAGLLAGRPIPEIELVLLRSRWGAAIGPFTSESFRALRLPAGEVGEIVVSGQHVVRGYLHGRGDEETKFDVDGVRWHRTGDLGKLDGTERLWLLGRCAAAMDDGRGTLYPFAVECAAQQHPGVRRAALASVAGRRILAYEAGKSGPVETEIRATLSWANLDAVVTVAKIPLDARHNSKIDYAALAKSLRGR